jgi:hypothetical protein
MAQAIDLNTPVEVVKKMRMDECGKVYGDAVVKCVSRFAEYFRAHPEPRHYEKSLDQQYYELAIMEDRFAYQNDIDTINSRASLYRAGLLP